MMSLSGNVNLNDFKNLRANLGQRGNIVPKGYDVGRLQQFTPEMMELWKNQFAHLSPDSPLARMAGGDQSYFDEMEKPILRQFAGLQGNLASRFSSQGIGGRNSSGFQNTMNQASNEFAQGLQAKRTEMMNQAIRDLMGLSNQVLGQNPYENFMSQKKQKEGSGLGGIIGGALGGAGGYFAGGGNPLTALQGANVGYNIGSKF